MAGITGHQTFQKLEITMRASLTDYEKGLMEEFGEETVSLQKINWLRWCRGALCEGDEVIRRREYPCRPDEAFEAMGDAVLDVNTTARWTKFAISEPPSVCRFELSEDEEGKITVDRIPDNMGHVSIWEDPQEGLAYAAGVDPAGGTKDGDFIVATVLRVDTGDQVAEYRSRTDPDLAIDQIEALLVYFNQAYTLVEANSYGMPFARSLEDRGTVPLFEREVPDRREPGKTNKLIGWLTTAKTRESLMTVLRQSWREERCRVRSIETLNEARTLTVVITTTGLERIQARDGCHDDGLFAHAMAQIGRNRVLPVDLPVGKKLDEEGEVEYGSMTIESLIESSFDRPKRLPSVTRQVHHIHGQRLTVDGKRNVL